MNSQYSQFYYCYTPSQDLNSNFYSNLQSPECSFNPWGQFMFVPNYSFIPLNFSVENHEILSSIERISQGTQMAEKKIEEQEEINSLKDKSEQNTVFLQKKSYKFMKSSKGARQYSSKRTINLKTDLQKTKYKQSQTRNILTNVGSKVITYIQKKSKSNEILKRLYPQWDQNKIEFFYQYTSNLKKKLGKYLTIPKLRQFWYGNNMECNQQIHEAIRRISYKYLTQKFILETLHSKRIRKHFQINHLTMKTLFIKQLKTK